jgi:DNA invertase Pin-like site-specific DNA recombinase
MIEDIKKELINTVVVKKIDRISRSILDFERLYMFFAEKKITFKALQGSIETETAIGRGMMRSVLVFAQMERELTAERTRDGMASKGSHGGYLGGYPILGYDIDYEASKFIPNENERPIVQMIFEIYRKTGSLSETAKQLNEKGYRTKEWTSKKKRRHAAGKFGKSGLSRMLKSPLYIGMRAYKGGIVKGEQEAIIEKELFDEVQKILAINNVTKKSLRSSSKEFLLSGLVRCGTCRSGMGPSYSTSKGRPYFYYRCWRDNDRSKDPCTVKRIKARELEKLVVNELKQLGRNPHILKEVAENAVKADREKVKEFTDKIAGLEKTMHQIRQEAKNLLSVLREEGSEAKNCSFVIDELKGLEQRESQIKTQIGELEIEKSVAETRIIDVNVVYENVKEFNAVFDKLSLQDKFDLIHLVVKRITYYDQPLKKDKQGKSGKIKMDLWELPIGPPDLDPNSANYKGFAESRIWLLGHDSNM